MFAQITQFIIEIIVQIYSYTGNLGVAIIIFTVLIRSILLPLTLPSLKAQKKMRELTPELNKLKKKHADKAELQKAQLALYQRHNVNPLAGCLPQVAQIVVLILLYRALITFLGQTEFNGIALNMQFLGLNLAQPDQTYILPVVAAVTQLILSLMILPGGETPDMVDDNDTSEVAKDQNKQEDDMADMASTMQRQMVFMMPVMTGFIATRFPAGLALYWVATTVFSVAQQWIISGPGGLLMYPQRLLANLRGDSAPVASKKTATTSPKPKNNELASALSEKKTTKKSKKKTTSKSKKTKTKSKKKSTKKAKNKK